jgi:hypothetical protein
VASSESFILPGQRAIPLVDFRSEGPTILSTTSEESRLHYRLRKNAVGF